MNRTLTLAALLFAPMAVAAAQPQQPPQQQQQQQPQPIPMPPEVLAAAVNYLQNGGTHNEGLAIGKQIVAAAQEHQRSTEQANVLAARDKTINDLTQQLADAKKEPAK